MLMVPPGASEAQLEGHGVSLVLQIWYIFTRNLRITVRDPFGSLGLIFEAVTIGALVGWIFYQLPSTLTGIRSMQGFIYTCLGVQGYLTLLFATWKVSVDMKV